MKHRENAIAHCRDPKQDKLQRCDRCKWAPKEVNSKMRKRAVITYNKNQGGGKIGLRGGGPFGAHFPTPPCPPWAPKSASLVCLGMV